MSTYMHGESHTRLHNTWMGMIKRCKSHPRYAGRGIKVCDEWQNYITFAEWARSHGYADDLTIERIDVNGDYCPENCSWIPLNAQARNRRTTRWVEYRGEKMSLAEACERAGLPYKQVFERIQKRGWSVERALNTPIAKVEKSELHKRCDALGLDYHMVYQRIRQGWSEKDAMTIKSLGNGANQSSYVRNFTVIAKSD